MFCHRCGSGLPTDAVFCNSRVTVEFEKLGNVGAAPSQQGYVTPAPPIMRFDSVTQYPSVQPGSSPQYPPMGSSPQYPMMPMSSSPQHPAMGSGPQYSPTQFGSNPNNQQTGPMQFNSSRRSGQNCCSLSQ